jgi:hypothetical protein
MDQFLSWEEGSGHGHVGLHLWVWRSTATIRCDASSFGDLYGLQWLKAKKDASKACLSICAGQLTSYAEEMRQTMPYIQYTMVLGIHYDSHAFVSIFIEFGGSPRQWPEAVKDPVK